MNRGGLEGRQETFVGAACSDTPQLTNAGFQE